MKEHTDLAQHRVTIQRLARSMNGEQRVALLWVTLHEMRKEIDLALIRINDLTFNEPQA